MSAQFETVTVPLQPLAELEDGFARFWLTVSNVTAQIEKGRDPQLFVPLLRQELSHALQSFYNWRSAKWAGQGNSAELQRSPPLRRASQQSLPASG